MTPEQIAKLRSELDVVQTNAQVLGEMLITLQPGEEHPQDLDLLMVILDSFIHKCIFHLTYSYHICPGIASLRRSKLCFS
jgi:hypothetical protein